MAHFEDYKVGDKLGSIQKGPMRSAHVMRWSAAIENWHRIHYDETFAREHDKLAGVLVQGSWKQHVLVQLVKDAIGHEAWLWKLSFRYKGPDLVGDTIIAEGEVKQARAIDGLGFLTLAVRLAKPDGSATTEGQAVAVVPLRGGKPVPYPFEPTEAQAAADLFAEG